MLRKLIPAAAAAAIIALPASAVGSTGPSASASGSCPDKSNFAGAVYVVNISTSGVSCGAGLKVIKAHLKAGAGNRTVKGYKCKQGKKNTSPTNFNATVSCSKGGKSVKFLYQKNT